MSFQWSCFLNALAGLAMLFLPVTATGQLTADYTYDSTGFFSAIPAAKAAAEAALADLNAAINQDLAPIGAGDESVTGTFNGALGQASATLTMNASIQNPSDGSIENISVARDQSEVRIFLGARPQPFTVGRSVLGTGGPGGAGFGVTGEGFTNSDVAQAATAAEAQANAIYSRGGGPKILGVSLVFAGTQLDVDFGLAHGAISFDNDTDNNNVNDLTEGVDPGDFFHFDHTTPPAAGKTDFYSVALHEAMHAIGLGASSQWQGLNSSGTWTGTDVVSYLGTGAGSIDDSGGHVMADIPSPRITDGGMQDSVLVSVGAAGQRAVLTELDLAFLRDMGFAGAVVPDRPADGDFSADGMIDSVDIDFYRGTLGADAGIDPKLDLNNDGTISLADHTFLITNLIQRSDGQPGTLLGDVNLDGEVDVLRDAAALVESLGKAGVFGYSEGDLNADGTVDVLNDAAILIENLGESVSAGGVSVAAVPEPDVALLVFLAGSVGCLRRRSARRRIHG